MTSDDGGQSPIGAGWERCSPLPYDADSHLKFTDSGAASSELTTKTGLIFVTGKTNKESEPTHSKQEGVISLASPRNPILEELWENVERVMAARQSNVREVMEEFGIADASEADQLEEELWQVVEGKLTLMEAADLV